MNFLKKLIQRRRVQEVQLPIVITEAGLTLTMPRMTRQRQKIGPRYAKFDVLADDGHPRCPNCRNWVTALGIYNYCGPCDAKIEWLL